MSISRLGRLYHICFQKNKQKYHSLENSDGDVIFWYIVEVRNKCLFLQDMLLLDNGEKEVKKNN